MFVFHKGTFNFFTVLIKMPFNVRTVFQSERVLKIFNVVISGMKHNFTRNVENQIWSDYKFTNITVVQYPHIKRYFPL